MKKIKPCVIAILVIMTVLCLSACKTNKKMMDETTKGGSVATTQASTTESTSVDNKAASSESHSKESTGVIDGMMNDVEKGVDDITGESNGHPTSGAVKDSPAN